MKEDIYKYWGKADKEGNYHLLVYHCLDVAAVGKVWLEKSPAFVKRAARICGISEKSFRELFLFFLVDHDLGKLAIGFQSLNLEIAVKLQGKVFKFPYSPRHDQRGYEMWNQNIAEYLLQSFEFSEKELNFSREFLEIFARISFGHHGMPPERKRIPSKKMEIFWDWMNCMKKLFFSEEALQEIKKNANSTQEKKRNILKELKSLSWQLAGVVSICDWIASGDEEFSYCSDEMPLEKYFTKSCAKAQKAMKRAGLFSKKISSNVGAKRLFPNFADNLTPLQKYCDEVVVSGEPQLFILEDVTGTGKTEAALILASRIMAAGGGKGCFVALPTMATSNAMYERMAKVYSLIYEEGQRPSLILAHGSRQLSKKFADSYSTCVKGLSQTSGEYDENTAEGEAHCSQWLANSSKKALLADVGVGTVDQVLLAGLPVRYQSLRAYGMSQNVLIVDEVHSFDPYMLILLENMIRAQASFGRSVILLSATLPLVVRSRFCGAFAKGLEIESPKIKERDAFPLVTSLNSGEFIEKEIGSSHFANKEVRVEFKESLDEIYELIEKASLQGKCVCWIRNTIFDVLDAYRGLKSRGLVEVEIFHSRFALKNRLDIEQRVVSEFGKESTEKQRKGKVLIASQVVEQSLDLDFDLMVSDLAPIDLLIQRAGRLHRHWRGDRGDAVLYCLIPSETKNPKEDWYSAAFPKAQWVYKDVALLWKTKEILRKQKIIKMPQEARLLVESVYGDEFGIAVPEIFIESENLAWSDILTKETFAKFNSLKFDQGYSRSSSYKWDEDENASTRLSDPTVTIYLCSWEDDEIKPLFEEEPHKWEISSLSIRKSSFPCVEYDLNVKTKIEELKNQRRFKYNSEFLVFVGEALELVGENKEGKVVLRYDFKLGLIIEKSKDKGEL